MVAGLFLLALSSPVHRAVLQVFEEAKGIMAGHPFLGPALFVILSALSAMFAFFSSAVLVPPAVYAWGPVPAPPCSGRRMLAARVVRAGLGLGVRSCDCSRPAGRLRVSAAARREGCRFRPAAQLLPRSRPGARAARFPPRAISACAGTAELPYAVGTTLLGASFVSRRFGLLISLGAVAALTAFLLGRALRRRLGTPRRPA
jgi:hypothetical protein